MSKKFPLLSSIIGESLTDVDEWEVPEGYNYGVSPESIRWMLNSGMEIDEIRKSTGFSREYIESLQDDSKFS